MRGAQREGVKRFPLSHAKADETERAHAQGDPKSHKTKLVPLEQPRRQQAIAVPKRRLSTQREQAKRSMLDATVFSWFQRNVHVFQFLIDSRFCRWWEQIHQSRQSATHSLTRRKGERFAMFVFCFVLKFFCRGLLHHSMSQSFFQRVSSHSISVSSPSSVALHRPARNNHLRQLLRGVPLAWERPFWPWSRLRFLRAGAYTCRNAFFLSHPSRMRQLFCVL